MKDTNHSIFRAEAVQRYAQSRVEPVLPRLVSPRVFMLLWILLGLFMASGVLAWFAQVPVYATGSAVVINGRDTTQFLDDDLLVVAFVTPENLRRLHVRQTLILHVDGASKRVTRPIMAVEPEVSSPEKAQKRFALSTGAASAISQPSAVAIARLDPFSTGLPTAAYVGSIYRAEIEVGSRRVLSLLPLIGRFFGE